jgi:regulator of sigma E protease
LENHGGIKPGHPLNGKVGPSSDNAEPVVDDSPATFKHWFAKNAPTLLILIALLVAVQVIYSPGPRGWWIAVKVLLGLSFVVFFHELGHHLAAKWCDVHVTAFSIGFGPVIPGCWFKWGETVYKFALFPLGGYVQMVGQVDGDEGSDGSEDDPRSFRNKSVGARMLIISAGVIMNVILAIICFILVYRIPGKTRAAGVVEGTDTGSPAFTIGLHTAAEIVKLDDQDYPYFDTLKRQVASTAKGQILRLESKRSFDKQTSVSEFEPRKLEGDSNPLIGIQNSHSLHVAFTMPGSPAAEAKPPFQAKDEIIGMTDPATGEVTELPVDPRDPNKRQRDYFEFLRRMQDLAGQTVKIEVKRGKEKKTLEIAPAFRNSLGVRMKMGRITARREKSEAAEEKVVASEKNGDVILQVEITDAHGKSIVYGSSDVPLDPERLPMQLKRWAAELNKAGKQDDALVKLKLERERQGKGGEQKETVEVRLKWDYDWTYDSCLPLARNSPLAIAELGIAYQIMTIVDGVGTSIADNPLQKGDAIVNYRFTIVDDKGKETTGDWLRAREELKQDQWAHFSYAHLLRPLTYKKVMLKVNRGKDENGKDDIREVELIPVADKSYPLVERGLIFSKDTRNQKASNTWDAIVMGLTDTHQNMLLVFTGLRQLITGRLSVKDNLGGPLLIFKQAYYTADFDDWELVFFMGLISINLAVINALPIPVLDGGHMFFLLYEAIRGKPLAESVRGWATYVGLAIILSLMIFVFYLDIMRELKGS